MDRKYFQITYDFDKLSDDEKQAILATAQQNWKDGKAVSAGWESIAKVENNDWIKIADGGFDDGREILITDGKEVWTDTVMFDYEDGVHFLYFDNGSDPEAVTHWQPKPEPPKERMNDNH